MVYAREVKHKLADAMYSISRKQSGSVTSRVANCFWWSQKPLASYATPGQQQLSLVQLQCG